MQFLHDLMYVAHMAKRIAKYPDTSAILNDWADRLRLEREKRRWTQPAVAAMLGVQQSTLSRWETGRVSVPDDQKVRLAGLYGAHPADLFAWPEQRPPVPAALPVRKAAA